MTASTKHRHRDRRRRLHRLGHRAGGAGEGRRRRHHGGGLGDHRGCRRRMRWPIARGTADGKAGLGRRNSAHARRQKEKTQIMCGIVGIAGTRDVAPVILEALKRLEYRGYDSAGIATLVRRPDRAPPLARQTVQAGRGAAARRRCRAAPASATPAGPPMARPPKANAHPHATARVAIVHNGIIENFRELRDELIATRPQIRIRDRQRSRRPSGHRQSGPRAWRPTRPPRRRWRG